MTASDATPPTPLRLFEPFTLRGLQLRNRLVRSATAECMCGPDGVPEPRQAELYRELARGGIGLLITGHAYVHARGKCHAGMLAADDDRMLRPLAELAAAAHAGGARIALQINHGGRACSPDIVPQPLAPSAILIPQSEALPEALDPAGIAAITAAFAAAAARARAAGFDAVQIHAAHGYLVSQFLSPITNHRHDAYGGPLANRARFALEVVAAVRAAVGSGYPVLAKLGVTDFADGGLAIEEGAEVAAMLAAAGVDAIETSTGMKGAIRTRITRPEREAYLLELARAVKAHTGVPVILVGGLRSRPVMERLLAEGIDLISLCRPLICEPDLPNRLRSDPVAVAACISCGRCWPETAGAGTTCKRREQIRPDSA
jgi:2,4-dienoyl-CoA reductase-like NADH-dependent reductase (Old Yellow Enzyme family)